MTNNLVNSSLPFELVAYNFATTFNLMYGPKFIAAIHERELSWLNQNGPDNWPAEKKRIRAEFSKSPENCELIYNIRMDTLDKVGYPYELFSHLLYERYEPYFGFELHPESYAKIEAFMNEE